MSKPAPPIFVTHISTAIGACRKVSGAMYSISCRATRTPSSSRERSPASPPNHSLNPVTRASSRSRRNWTLFTCPYASMSDHRRGTLTQYGLVDTAPSLAAGARRRSGRSRLTDSTAVEVRVLGELEVVGPGGVAIDVAGSRLRRLVTRLAVDAGHVVTSAALVDAVWGDEPPADPVGALQTLVSRLRRALGNPTVVQQSHQGYRLTVASDAVDAERFRRLARRGRDLLAAGDAATARSTLAEALDLWRGPALADADDGDYAVALAARLEEERLDALAARVDADLALGHAADVVAELEDRTRANPLREQLTGQLMRALAATGRPAEALAAYERLRSTLADTLGTDPSPALRELHVALLREDVPGAPPIGRRPGLRAGLTSFLGREAETER